MLSLRRERVEKQNSRGEIVRKEQVTVTKKLNASNKPQAKKPECPPSKAVLLSNPYKKFPPQGRQLDNINEKDLGYLISELLKRQQQGGFSKANAKNFDAEISNAEDSDVEDVEGSDVEDVEGSDAEYTNSEEFEADDTNSENSEDGDTNSEESQVESSNSEESEVDEAEDEDISSDESQVESSNYEESEADEAEDEDIGSEESSEEVEDSDDEPPRPLIDINRSEHNLPTGRIFTDIDQCINNSLLKRHLMDFNPKRSNLFNGRAETRISRLIDYTPPERLSWIQLKHK